MGMVRKYRKKSGLYLFLSIILINFFLLLEDITGKKLQRNKYNSSKNKDRYAKYTRSCRQLVKSIYKNDFNYFKDSGYVF